VHTDEVIPANLGADIKASAYADGDFHRVYFGEVLVAYAAPDVREKLQRLLLSSPTLSSRPMLLIDSSSGPHGDHAHHRIR
jgi:hypothetical protein